MLPSLKQRSPTPSFGETIAWLNQRYKCEWDRAQGLQDELNAIKRSRSYRLLAWFHRLRAWFQSIPNVAPVSPSIHLEFLETIKAPPVGTVSIIIPFKDRLDLLENCLQSLGHSTYTAKEVVLVDNGSTSHDMRRFLNRLEDEPGYSICSSPGPFNFSKLCNIGARQSRGDYLVFLNNDTEIVTTDWLENLLMVGEDPTIGIVGATLCYPDGTIQHAGLFAGADNRWTHAYRGMPGDYAGDHGELHCVRTVPAVTGACLLIRRALFTALGGFSESYPVTHNDVDLCRRIRESGYRVAITPNARLVHFESLSRGYSLDCPIRAPLPDVPRWQGCGPRETPGRLLQEFERLGERSPWMASFVIDGQVFGSGLNHQHDVRPRQFFRLVADPKRILELGSCQGGGTFQLAKHPGVCEVIAIEGRAYNIKKAQLVQQALEVNNVSFLQGDLENFDFTPLGRMDAVYCVGLLYHLPRPWELLAKLEAVTDLLYINTHYCPLNQVAMTLHGYEGKKWLELGYQDPLSGMSSWSFWPTLPALTKMLLDAGFVPEILETDTLGPGQSPHGTTILARRAGLLCAEYTTNLMRSMQRVLLNLPPSAGSLQSVAVSGPRRTLSRLKTFVGQKWKGVLR